MANRWTRIGYWRTREREIITYPKNGMRQIRQLKEMNWLEQQYNLILLGPRGVGKNHLAIGVGLEAIEQGYQVSHVYPDGETDDDS